jgi:hypothetical protein
MGAMCAGDLMQLELCGLTQTQRILAISLDDQARSAADAIRPAAFAATAFVPARRWRKASAGPPPADPSVERKRPLTTLWNRRSGSALFDRLNRIEISDC